MSDIQVETMFSKEELSNILAYCFEKNTTIRDLIRTAVLDQLYC